MARVPRRETPVVTGVTHDLAGGTAAVVVVPKRAHAAQASVEPSWIAGGIAAFLVLVIVLVALRRRAKRKARERAETEVAAPRTRWPRPATPRFRA